MGPPTVPFSKHAEAIVNPPGYPRTEPQKQQISLFLDKEPSSLFKDVRDGKQYSQAAINMGRAVFGDPNSLSTFVKSRQEDMGFKRDPDGTMRQNFRPIRGQTEIFYDWANPDTIHQMHGYGSEMWNTTKDWIDKNGSRLFKNDLAHLNELTARNQNVTIAWDNSNQRLTAVPSVYVRRTSPSGYPIGQADTQGPKRAAEEMQTVLDRYTPLMKVWGAVAKEEGIDPNAFILSSLRNNGVDLKKIPSLENAIKSSHMQYTDEGDTEKGSLSGFLSNPGGGQGGARNNAPAASSGAPRGVTNYGNSIPGQPIDIPEGVSPRDYLQQLRSQGKF
jgi:hypothetical protein